MNNSQHLAEDAHKPLAAYAAGREETELPIDQWPASLVDDMVAGLMTDLLHYARVNGRRSASATLDLVKTHFEQEA